MIEILAVLFIKVRLDREILLRSLAISFERTVRIQKIALEGAELREFRAGSLAHAAVTSDRVGVRFACESRRRAGVSNPVFVPKRSEKSSSNFGRYTTDSPISTTLCLKGNTTGRQPSYNR